MSRAVLVTGASRGIDRAVAQAFAALGDRVAVHYGSDAEQARALVDDAAQALGGLDVLVNNAGVFEAHPPTSTSWEQWQQVWSRTLAVNLSGAAHATYSAVPHLAARGGAVVNVSSRGAFRGEPDCPAYGASKAGHAGGTADTVPVRPRAEARILVVDDEPSAVLRSTAEGQDTRGGELDSPKGRSVSAVTGVADDLTAFGYALPGTLASRFMRCGKPNCRCKAEPPVLHGPYLHWTRTVAGKTVTRTLTPEQAARYQPWFDNARRLRASLAELENLSLQAFSRRRGLIENRRDVTRRMCERQILGPAGQV